MAIVYGSKYSGKTKLGIAIESTLKSLIKKKKHANLTEDVICKELSGVISSISKGNFDITIGAFDYVNAFAYIPLLDNNNPLISGEVGKYYKEGLDTDIDYFSFKKQFPDMVGGFDFDKWQFTGWATKLKFKITLGYRCMYPKPDDNDMNVGTATFILCHEIGHIIEKMLGMGTLVRENYILGQTHSRLMGVTDTNKRAKIVTAVLNEEGVKNASDDIRDVVDEETSLYTIVVGKLRTNIRSELDSYGYDQTGSESLADYFANKQGFGGYSIYLARDGEETLSHDDIHYLVSWVMGGMAMGLLVSSAGAMGAVVLAGMAYSALLGYSYDTNTKRYDDVPARLQRNLNAFISNIKSRDTEITNEELIQVKRMIKILDSLPRESIGVIQSVFEYVNPRGRKERNARRLQKSLESLGDHKLSIKASEYLR